jgi:hypothetical protein
LWGDLPAAGFTADSGRKLAGHLTWYQKNSPSGSLTLFERILGLILTMPNALGVHFICRGDKQAADSWVGAMF